MIISVIRVYETNADAKLFKLCKLSLKPPNADAKKRLSKLSTKLLWLSDPPERGCQNVMVV